MAFGVTAQGFVRKRLEDIKLEREQDLRDALGENINLLPEEVLGQIVGIGSEREALIWELMEAIYESQYPDQSEGVTLDNVASITGSVRQNPTKSQISGQLMFGTIGTLIPLGSKVSVFENASAIFVTLADVTLVAGADEVQDVTFSGTPTSGSFRLNFGGFSSALINFDDLAADVEAALEAMSSIPTGSVSVSGSFAAGFTITFSGDSEDGLGKRNVDILTVSDNTLDDGGAVTVTVTETVAGVPQGEINMEAETEGATDAPSGTLSEIETPVAGWDATVNPLDALVGQDEESDAEFKIRRLEEVAKAGAATPNAVFADVSDVENVTAVVVFYNNLDITDLDGRPPHSVDIVVQNGDEDDIAAAIFDTVGGGITFVGDITKMVTDSQGIAQTVKFSRPTEVDIYVEIDLTIDSDLFPVDGTDQVEALVLAYGNALGIGEDVVVFGSDPQLSASFDSVPGITDFAIRVGKTAGPTLDDNVVIALREVAAFDSSRITAAVP